MNSSSIHEDIAASLLQIGAITLRPNEPFTWSSGLKSPIYCDNRLTMSYPKVRGQIAAAFAAIIQEQYTAAEVIAGTSTAGIPHAAWVSERLDLPMIYIRDKAKGHGKQNLLEGRLNQGQKVIVIEDLISTGGSSLQAAQAVQDAGGEVLAVLAIFTYELDQAAEAFHVRQIPLQTLSNYSSLLDVAMRTGEINAAELTLLQSWRDNPAQFGV